MANENLRDKNCEGIAISRCRGQTIFNLILEKRRANPFTFAKFLF